jgi:hypothetical protein
VLFLEGFPETLLSDFLKDPKLTSRTALFDLSQVFLMEPVVRKLNKTKSIVYQEFEEFLKSQWKSKIVDITSIERIVVERKSAHHSRA